MTERTLQLQFVHTWPGTSCLAWRRVRAGYEYAVCMHVRVADRRWRALGISRVGYLYQEDCVCTWYQRLLQTLSIPL